MRASASISMSEEHHHRRLSRLIGRLPGRFREWTPHRLAVAAGNDAGNDPAIRAGRSCNQSGLAWATTRIGMGDHQSGTIVAEFKVGIIAVGFEW